MSLDRPGGYSYRDPIAGHAFIPHDEPTAAKRVEELYQQPNAELQEQIARGKSLARCIANGEAVENPTLENARDLIVFMNMMCAAYHEHHTSGTVRIDDPEGRIFAFIDRCKGPDGVGSYGRLSSHYNNHRAYYKKHQDGMQRGLDLDDLELPGGKHTILFSRLPDGTTFIKLEQNGVPPFWKKGFRTKANFLKFVRHSLNFLEGNAHKVDQLAPRRENTPFKPVTLAHAKKFEPNAATANDSSSYFAKAAKAVIAFVKEATAGPLAKLSSLFIPFGKQELSNQQVLDQLLQQIERMERYPHLTAEDYKQLISYRRMAADIEALNIEDKLKSYKGGRQGNEVVLPSFKEYFAYQGISGILKSSHIRSPEVQSAAPEKRKPLPPIPHPKSPDLQTEDPSQRPEPPLV